MKRLLLVAVLFTAGCSKSLNTCQNWLVKTEWRSDGYVFKSQTDVISSCEPHHVGDVKIVSNTITQTFLEKR